MDAFGEGAEEYIFGHPPRFELAIGFLPTHKVLRMPHYIFSYQLPRCAALISSWTECSPELISFYLS